MQFNETSKPYIVKSNKLFYVQATAMPAVVQFIYRIIWTEAYAEIIESRELATAWSTTRTWSDLIHQAADFYRAEIGRYITLVVNGISKIEVHGSNP